MRMNVSRYLSGMLFVALPLTVANATDDAQEVRLAKDAASQFFKALNAKRLDDLIQLADVPWWSGDSELVKDRGQLRKLLQGIVEKNGDRKFPIEVTQVLTYAEARKKIDDAKARALLDEVLQRNDRVVVFGRDEHALLVRVREGKARIVGGAR